MDTYQKKKIIKIVFIFLILILINQILTYGILGSLASIIQFIIMGISGVIAITFHEVAHGYVSYKFGDPTPKLHGRLTLNPLKHLDPVGVIMIFLIKIGWAKPVPIDPRYYQNPKRDLFLVAAAGPFTNLMLAILSSIIFTFITKLQIVPIVIIFLRAFFSYMIIINTALFAFNLFPIPPLDGSKMLAYFLPDNLAYRYLSMETFGFVILIILIATNQFHIIFTPILNSSIILVEKISSFFIF